MKAKFNDATELQIQSAENVGGLLQIRVINTTPEELRKKFSDELACKKIQVVDSEQVITEYEIAQNRGIYWENLRCSNGKSRGDSSRTP